MARHVEPSPGWPWWGWVLVVAFLLSWAAVFMISVFDIQSEFAGPPGDRTAVANVPAPALQSTPTASARPSPTPRPTPTQPRVFFHDCRDADKAKALPLKKGDPGYRSGLDSDRDGKACENYG